MLGVLFSCPINSLHAVQFDKKNFYDTISCKVQSFLSKFDNNSYDNTDTDSITILTQYSS